LSPDPKNKLPLEALLCGGESKGEETVDSLSYFYQACGGKKKVEEPRRVNTLAKYNHS
jgi:hypothetical protein